MTSYNLNLIFSGKTMRSPFVSVISGIILVLATVPGCLCGESKLKLKFYDKTCPSAETIVQKITWSNVKANPILAAKLLRLPFHDCFVRGCDASVLLDPVGGNKSEKLADANRSLDGFKVIDEIKSELEKECPSTVSCADIVALAARDAVSYQFGKPMWDVYTGRRDGRVSSAAEADLNMPSAHDNFTTLLKSFSNNGLDVVDLVALSGAHTIGTSRCPVFMRRLEGGIDPTMDPKFAQEIKTVACKNYRTEYKATDMDEGSSLSFDNHYYVSLLKHRGLLISDAALITDKVGATIVKRFADFPESFMVQFANSMKKMGEIGVLTGSEGEIRKNCRVFN